MRAILLVAICGAAGCGDNLEPAFAETGGELAVPGCGYSVRTRVGAEPPRLSDDRQGPDPTPRLVHLGIVGDPRTSMVAQWRTVDEATSAGSIRYAEGSDLPPSRLTRTARGLQFRYTTTGTDLYRMHQAHLCGLRAGTSYSYQVGHGSSWSPVRTFHTAPDVDENPDAEVVLGFAGDSRGGYDVWGQLVDELQQRAPDLLLYSGDAVTLGLAQQEWEEFLGVAEPLLATVPMVIAHGNHEANAVAFYSQFALPGDQENFGLTYGFARVFTANDTPEDVNALSTSIPERIDADFTEHADARWKLLVHHRPMWSSGSRHGSSTMLQAAWGPVVDAHRVDLVLNGHEHHYEISKPLAGGVLQPSNATGTVYLVAGGAGAELYGFAAPGPWSAYREQVHSAALVRVRRSQLSVEPFRLDGTAIEAGFTKSRP